MTTATWIILTISFLVLGLALRKAYQVHKQERLVYHLSEELDVLLHAAKGEIAKNKNLVETARHMIHEYTGSSSDLGVPSASDNLTSPEMLATIITVLINKLGMVKLSLDDFIAVPKDEYVSVYVDTNTKELVLTLNHGLEEDTSSMFSMSPKDDTFH